MGRRVADAFKRASLAVVVILSIAMCSEALVARRKMKELSTCGLSLSLSDDDKAELETGGVVLRAVGNASKLSLKGGESGGEILVGEMQSLKPTYLAEVIRTMPYEGNEDLPDKIVDILLGLDGSVRIPYISSKGKVCSLYKSATIVSNDMMPDGQRVVKVDVVMPPVDVIDALVTVRTYQDDEGQEYVRFSATNEDYLRFHNIRVVGVHRTLIALLITNDGKKWTMYAVCAANAIRLPFLEQSIRVSFLNRIKGFCDYVVAKLDG